MALADPVTEWTVDVIRSSIAEKAKVLIDAGAMRMRDLNALLAVPTHYRPEGGQKLLHEHEGAVNPETGLWEPTKIKIAAGGWRAGKSRYTAREVTLPAITTPKGRAWILGRDYDLGREEFSYVVEDIAALGYPVIADWSHPLKGQWRLVLSNGFVVETQTTDDLNAIEAANLDVIVLVEAGGLPTGALKAAEGRVFEKRGKVILSGRFRGSHSWYVDLFNLGKAPNKRRVVSASLHSWDNVAIFPPCDPATCTVTTTWPEANPAPLHGGFHNPDIQYELANKSSDEFGEMIASEPRPDRSLVYADWWDRATHMVRMDFEANLTGAGEVVDAGRKTMGWRLPKNWPLEMWIDPGYRGAFAVLIRQRHPQGIMVIDEIYVRGETAVQVCTRLKQKWYWPYIKTGVIDVAGNQHQGMPSVTETIYKETGIWCRSQVVLVHEGIERVRVFLKDPKTKRPRVWFSPACYWLADEMEQGYRYHEDRSPADDPLRSEDPRASKEEPIEKRNHACAALAYGLMDNFGKSDLSMEVPQTRGY
jgi:hypothetical protein